MANEYMTIEELAEIRAAANARRERERAWFKEYVASWCNAKVEFNGHFIPCDKKADHPGLCAIGMESWRNHAIQSDDYCRHMGCPAIVEP